jgi:uncharacterized membrane protein
LIVKRMTLIAILLSAAVAACSSTNGLGTLSSVQVSFATRATTAIAASSVGSTGIAADTQVVAGDTLVLTKVEVVLRQIELRRADATNCTPTSTNDTPCKEFEIGPVLVSLPLTPGAQQVFAADVPAGTYGRMEFEVHKPDDGDPADQAFIQQYPDFNQISIRVAGTFNGTPFVHTTDLDVEQELDLVPNLTVAEGQSTNLTIFVSVTGWYVVNGVLVDPTTANTGGANESAVNNNIKDSFRAFEDADHSGSGD